MCNFSTTLSPWVSPSKIKIYSDKWEYIHLWEAFFFTSANYINVLWHLFPLCFVPGKLLHHVLKRRGHGLTVWWNRIKATFFTYIVLLKWHPTHHVPLFHCSGISAFCVHIVVQWHQTVIQEKVKFPSKFNLNFTVFREYQQKKMHPSKIYHQYYTLSVTDCYSSLFISFQTSLHPPALLLQSFTFLYGSYAALSICSPVLHFQITLCVYSGPSSLTCCQIVSCAFLVIAL